MSVREVALDLSTETSPKVFGGYEGENNATKLVISIPSQWTSPKFSCGSFIVNFETSYREKIESEPILLSELVNNKIEIDLWQQLMCPTFLIVQVFGYDPEENKIYKTARGFLEIQKSIDETTDVNTNPYRVSDAFMNFVTALEDAEEDMLSINNRIDDINTFIRSKVKHYSVDTRRVILDETNHTASLEIISPTDNVLFHGENITIRLRSNIPNGYKIDSVNLLSSSLTNLGTSDIKVMDFNGNLNGFFTSKGLPMYSVLNMTMTGSDNQYGDKTFVLTDIKVLDASMSSTSINAVQNNVIKSYVDNKISTEHGTWTPDIVETWGEGSDPYGRIHTNDCEYWVFNDMAVIRAKFTILVNEDETTGLNTFTFSGLPFAAGLPVNNTWEDYSRSMVLFTAEHNVFTTEHEVKDDIVGKTAHGMTLRDIFVLYGDTTAVKNDIISINFTLICRNVLPSTLPPFN